MDIKNFYAQPDEKPLDRIVEDGGFCGIFRTIGCIGDSLSSGEFESLDNEGIVGWHDFYEYSWGQYMARTLGNKVYNFSRGGLTAQTFFEDYSNRCGVFDYDKVCQCYIIALGVNDISSGIEVGDPKNIDPTKTNVEDKSFLRYYTDIIRNIKRRQPDAKIFLMTMPRSNRDAEREEKVEKFSEAIRSIEKMFNNIYILDFRKYAPVYDDEFRKHFYLAGHLNPAGYMLTAKMVMSYIDYIIRKNPEDFTQVGFMGTPYYNKNYKR